MDVGRLNLSGERGLKKCGFGIRIHWFRVDGGPIREKKKTMQFNKYPNLCEHGLTVQSRLIST